jgi:large subunit ribosomal protein L25
MDRIELSAAKRDVLGKKVESLRRRGITPANLYGHNVQSTSLQIDTAELKRTLAQAGKSSLVALKIDGGKRPRMVVFREVQRHPMTGSFLHVDLYEVSMEQKIKIEVPLVLVSEAPALKDRGGILVQNMTSIEVECLPANMPHSFEVDLSVLQEIDQAVHVKDLRVPDGITVLADREQSIVQISRSRVEAEMAEVAAEAAAEAAEEAEGEAGAEEPKAGAPEAGAQAAE